MTINGLSVKAPSCIIFRREAAGGAQKSTLLLRYEWLSREDMKSISSHICRASPIELKQADYSARLIYKKSEARLKCGGFEDVSFTLEEVEN